MEKGRSAAKLLDVVVWRNCSGPRTCACINLARDFKITTVVEIRRFLVATRMSSAAEQSLTRCFCTCTCYVTPAGPQETSSFCEMYDKLHNSLQKYFSFSSFRDGHLEALIPLLHGRDVFVRMATGSGKSICLFLRPLALSDTTICVVISPLNGLMEQQVCYLYIIGLKELAVM